MAHRVERTVQIPLHDRGGTLHGALVVPAGAPGLVIFAHGSGSSRHSPRNRKVAESLQRRNLATLLVDLLTEEEDAVDRRTRQLRFDIDLLADRLATTAAWLSEDGDAAGLPIGYFGASTGAGAALVAAARRPEGIFAVVSRGGRPDLAGDQLREVRAPTLLIVGGLDTSVVSLNRAACRDLSVTRHIEIVPGATHLFEERGALAEVARLAGDWFVDHLVTNPAAVGGADRATGARAR